MSSTVQNIITRAFRKIGVLGAGASPNTIDNADALESLKCIYQNWISQGTFGQLTDVIATGESYTAHENERIFRNSDSTTNIILPETVSNGTYVSDYEDGYVSLNNSNDQRLPYDGSVVSITDAFTRQTTDYIYDGSIKEWCNITELLLTDIAPLSHRNSAGLTAVLGLALADEYGQPVGALTMREAMHYQVSLTNNYSQAGAVVTPTCYI